MNEAVRTARDGLIVGAMMFAAAAFPAHAGESAANGAFAKAVAEAKANLATPAGHRYDVAFSAHFEANFNPPLMACFKTTAHADASPFEMVFALSSDGKARRILVWPETNIAVCFSHQLETASFPVPPSDGYLAYMEMRFTP